MHLSTPTFTSYPLQYYQNMPSKIYADNATMDETVIAFWIDRFLRRYNQTISNIDCSLNKGKNQLKIESHDSVDWKDHSNAMTLGQIHTARMNLRKDEYKDIIDDIKQFSKFRNENITRRQVVDDIDKGITYNFIVAIQPKQADKLSNVSEEKYLLSQKIRLRPEYIALWDALNDVSRLKFFF